jgi:uncharacterized membrane protein YedE/YeeE
MSSALQSLAGGALIGLGASVLLVLNGHVAGISGVLGGILAPPQRGAPLQGETDWRWAFVAGLLAGGLVIARLSPSLMVAHAVAPLGAVAVAGLLVGFGSQLGRGCTSGHGVCGLSRLSGRSLVAVVTFMLTGALAATVVRHFVRGA